MKKNSLRLLFLTVISVLLSACFGPKTPQDVTQAFWDAVLDNEVKEAVEYSTLTEPKYYDSFSRNWRGYQPSFGKVLIDNKQAKIESHFASPANSGLEDISFTTYLVMRDGKWLVDYDSTNNAIHGGPLGDFINQLNRLGEEISRQFESSANSFSVEMERIGEELAHAAQSAGSQAEKSIEKHAAQLRQKLRELEESIERALKDHGRNLSDEDRQTLQEVSSQLRQDRENLSSPSPEVVSQGSSNMGKAQQQLDGIDSEQLVDYQKEWQALSREFARAMHEIMDELSGQAGNEKE